MRNSMDPMLDTSIGDDVPVVSNGVITWLKIIWLFLILACIFTAVQCDLSEAVEIDMEKIAMIESSGDPMAWNKADDSRGVFQLREIVVKEWNNFHPNDQHAFDDVWDAEVNTKIATWYMQDRCEQFIKAYRLQDNTLTQIALYNWGVGNVRKWAKAGGQFEDLPVTTQKYYLKYNGRLQ